MLLSCWAITKAMSDGKIKYIVLSFVFLGVGYNIKMSEALILLPALYVTYILASSIPLKKRFINLGISTLIFLVVSLSWAVIVDSVPSNDRPFIGSSTNNSVTQLMLGHNGLDRLKLGTAGVNRAKKSVPKPRVKSTKLYASSTDTHVKEPLNPDQIPGLLRLFSNNDMTDQISWFLPFAIIGFIASAIKEKLSIPLDREKKQALVLWFMWLLPEFLYFSFSRGAFHTYYMTTMAPPIAALTGIGVVSMLHLYKESNWKQFILPSAFIVNGLAEAIFLSYNYGKTSIYIPMMAVTIILSLVPALLLILKNKNIFMKMIPELKKELLTAIAFAGLIIAPTVWSFTPMFYTMNGGSPNAGLELTHNAKKPADIMNSNTKLINFLKSNNTNEKYMLAVPSATTYASSLILETGDAVMAIGGFSGNDKIISLDEFKQLVSNGEIRYALINIPAGNTSNEKKAKASGPNGDIINWIIKNGKAVQDSKWERVSKNKNSKNTTPVKLYDLKANHNSKKNTIDNPL